MAVSFTTSASAVTTDSLTTLARVKEYASITSSDDDTKLTRQLSAASRLIEKYCDRLFLYTARTEYHTGSGKRFLKLGAYGDSSAIVTRVAAEDDVLYVSNTSSSTVYARISTGASGATITYNYLTTAGGTPTSTSTGYGSTVTFATLATTISALGSGWSASAVNGYDYQQLSDMKPQQGPFDVRESPAHLRGYVVELGGATFDHEAGTLWFDYCLPHNTRSLKVTYSAGYTTIPDDVQLAAAALTAALYRMSDTDNSVVSEKLGDYSYTLADPSRIGGRDLPSISPDAAQLLAAYKRPRL